MSAELHRSSVTRTNSLMPRWSIALLLAGFVLGTLLPSFVFAAPKAASIYEGAVVISEFRTYGPDLGNDEFIEIFNRTNHPVNMDNWEIRRSSSGGSTYNIFSFPAGSSLAAGQYYLITGTSYSGSVQGDVEKSIGVADDGGIALLDGLGEKVDAVGMDLGSAYLEVDPLAPLSGTTNQSYQRDDNGCIDTDDNNADFSLISPSDPQNQYSIPVRCLKVINVTSTTLNGTYQENAPIVIAVQFSSNVNVIGFPTLLLETGATDRSATYASGSASDTLTFNYTVQSGDVSADLDYVNTNSLSLNGGTIVGAVGDADLTLPAPGEGVLRAGSLSVNKDIVIDNRIDNPTATSFVRQDPLSEITNADKLTFRVTFSEPVKNVDETDFSVSVLPTGMATVDTVTPMNVPVYASVYDVEVSGTDLVNLEGTVELDFDVLAFDIVDGASKPVSGNDPDIDETYTIENTSLSVTINQAGGQADAANETPVRFTVAFDEEIDASTFTVDDITQNGTVSGSLIMWSIDDSDGSDPTTFTLSADRIAENGTLIPSIDANKVNDLAGNGNSVSTSTDNTVTFYDDISPTVTINQASNQSDPTSVLPIEFTVSFSEPIITSIFTTSDITQSGTATGITWSIKNLGDDQHFTLSATKVTGVGTLNPSIAVNRVTDIVGNNNLASTNTDNTVTYTLPSIPTTRTILINEIAWSGTAADPAHEWIELYNPTNRQYDFSDGWKLISTDLSIDIELTGTIAPGGYYLLEDTTDEGDLDKNPISDIDADQIYSGSMSNTGEYLKLLAPDGSVIDTANKDGGSWPAGSSSPKYYSMERQGTFEDSDTAWITNTGIVRNGLDAENNEINGTPRQPNWAYSVTATPSPILPTKTPTSFPHQAVVLNEVLPRPGHDWNEDGVVNVFDEFIEIINRGNTPVNLQGWKLDDEYNLDSDPYSLPSVTLQAGGRIAIFGYTTHISLSDGGDTVRLLKSDGTIADVLTYTVIKTADQSWCRLPEKGFWNSQCFPTPNKENAGIGEFPALSAINTARSSCFVPDTAPASILSIECGPLGMNIYAADFWEKDLSSYWLTGQTKSSTWFH